MCFSLSFPSQSFKRTGKFMGEAYFKSTTRSRILVGQRFSRVNTDLVSHLWDRKCKYYLSGIQKADKNFFLNSKAKQSKNKRHQQQQQQQKRCLEMTSRETTKSPHARVTASVVELSTSTSGWPSVWIISTINARSWLKVSWNTCNREHAKDESVPRVLQNPGRQYRKKHKQLGKVSII